jgi:serine/threonine protein kinase
VGLMRHLHIGDKLDNRYEIQSRLLEGHLTNVWRAYDQHIEREVAIKTLHHDNPATRIRHEALTLGGLEHPHIVPVYDYSTTGEIPYLVMRLVSNYRLSDQLEQPVVRVQDGLRLAQRLGDAIDYLHQERVVHGDLRPANVLMGVQNQPYITNFAVALTLDDTGHAVNVGQGSRYYMAPEQYDAAFVGNSIDLYAFGIILFEVFTGRLPFGHNNIKDSLGARQQVNPQVMLPSVSEHRPDLPSGVDMILRRLTRFNPDERYATATEATDALSKVFYSGQKPIEGKIFISYARVDKEFVYSVANELRQAGIQLWIDQDIAPGANWDSSVEAALRECDMLLLIASPASMASNNVQDEWSYFLDKQKPVYTFIYQQCDLSFRLRRRQYITGTGDLLNDVAKIVDMLAGGTTTNL